LSYRKLESRILRNVDLRQDGTSGKIDSVLKDAVCPALPRRPESRKARKTGIPAFAGMTAKRKNFGFSPTP
jgi:hypothetical protein